MRGPGRDIWEAVAAEFVRQRGSSVGDLWLDGARPRSFHRGLFTLDVADEAVKCAIDGCYREDLEAIFLDITGSPVRLRTRVTSAEVDGASAPEAIPQERPRPRPARRRQVPPQPTSTVIPFTRHAGNALAARAVDSWIEGTANDFRLLFAYGPPGCGKTALAAHAVARLGEQDPDIDPLVLSGHALALDVRRAARNRSFGALQRDWGERDVVVLDEAHRLRAQRTAQEVTASLVGPALDRGGRVLVFSRHAPDAIHGLGERLRSYLSGGLVLALEAPNDEGRRGVLDALASSLPVEIEDAVLEAVARRCPGNLRDAVEIVERAAGQAAEEHRRVLVADVESALAAPPRSRSSIDALVALVAEETGVPADRIRTAEKSRDVAAARHLCVVLATRSLGLSSRQVCRALGVRSPSIVAYARQVVERRRNIDPEFERLIHSLQARLEGAQRDFAW